MARVFEIVTDQHHPTTGELILDEHMIIIALSHKTIKDWAYVLHDEDTYLEEDEKEQRKRLSDQWDDNRCNIEESKEEYIENRLTHRAGQLKAPHWHIVIRLDRNSDVEMIARWFNVKSNFIETAGKKDFIDKVEYLTHEHEKQQALGKHLYPDEKIRSNFNFREQINVRVAMRLKYGNRANELSDGDILQLHVMQDGWSMRRCRQEDPLAYIKVRNKLPNLRLDYLLDQPPQPFRISIYVDGKGGLGKGSICEYLGQRLFPDVENPCFVVGNDPRVAFDGYDGEPVLIWEDYRAYKFVQNFSREGTFAIFDSHPKVQSQQVKNSRIVLQNYVNIVNGIEPYTDFLAGLAGEYTAKDGTKHKAEDRNQVFRRFQQIICIREEEFDVLFNRGFIDRDSSLYSQYDLYNRVRGSMSQAMQRLEGEAKEHILVDLSQPAVDCYRMIEASHENKISKIEEIPEEFAHYGELKTQQDVWDELEDEAAEKDIEEYFLRHEYCDFTALWQEVYSDELLTHKKNISAMATFADWKNYGCPNAYDNNTGQWSRVEQ